MAVIELGEETCQSIGPFTVPLSILGLPDASVPELEFCVREFWISSARIWTVSIDVMLVFTVGGAIMLWRWFRQS